MSLCCHGVAAPYRGGDIKNQELEYRQNYQNAGPVEFRADFRQFLSTSKNQAWFLSVFGGSIHMRPCCHFGQNRQKPANLTTCEQGMILV
jgi:hypothetical protein